MSSLIEMKRFPDLSQGPLAQVGSETDVRAEALRLAQQLDFCVQEKVRLLLGGHEPPKTRDRFFYAFVQGKNSESPYNMLLALRRYARTGGLDGHIVSEDGRGSCSPCSFETVRDVFLEAIKLQGQGGFLPTITAAQGWTSDAKMQEKNQAIAVVRDGIMRWLVTTGIV